MRTRIASSVAAYSLLALAGSITFVLPETLTVEQAAASTPPDKITLTGLVHDFRDTHPDFGVTSADMQGHVVNLTDYELDANGYPAFDGSGNQVTTQARDTDGNNIAPVLANGGAAAGVPFTISAGRVIPSQAYYVRYTVLGAAMQNPTVTINVTTRLRIGSTTYDPFGSYTSATAGNVHDSNNPRNYIHPTSVAANTAMSALGRSYYKSGGSWTQFYNVDSNTGSTWVKVLRDGDALPAGHPFNNQAAVHTFLTGYYDPITQRVTLADNQAILLYEGDHRSGKPLR
jgi:hypothetical protein